MIKCKKEGIFFNSYSDKDVLCLSGTCLNFLNGKKGAISFHHGFKMLGLIPTTEERAYFQK